MGKLREHYMFVLMPLPLLLFALLPEEKLHRWRSTAFCGVLAALAGVELLALAAQAMVEAVAGSKCRAIMPWRVFAEGLRRPGLVHGRFVRYASPSTAAGSTTPPALPGPRC